MEAADETDSPVIVQAGRCRKYAPGTFPAAPDPGGDEEFPHIPVS